MSGDSPHAGGGEVRTLDQLERDAWGVILAVEGDDPLAVRLMEMGLLEGERVSMVGVAPLGDPLEFLVQGYHISLRRAEARRVRVRPD